MAEGTTERAATPPWSSGPPGRPAPTACWHGIYRQCCPRVRLRERCLVGATNFPQSIKYREGSVFARRSAHARRATEAPRGGLLTWGGPESPPPLALRSSMLSRNFPISFRKVCSHPPAPARVSSGAVNSFPIWSGCGRLSCHARACARPGRPPARNTDAGADWSRPSPA